MSFFDIRLAYSDKKGDHYIATQNIKAGSIVFSEEFTFASPLLIELSQHEKKNDFVSRCANWKCWKIVKKSTGYTCPTCNYSLYCNQECYKAVCKIHSKICDKAILEDHLSLAALYFALDIKRNVTFGLLPKGVPSKEFKLKILRYVKLLQVRFPGVAIEKLLNETNMLHFLGIPMKTFIGNYNYANGFFLFANYFNHDCDPNCFYFFAGKKIFIRALKDIKEGDEITIAYDADVLFTSKEMRQDAITNVLGCNCNCIRCTDTIVNERDQFLFEKMKGKGNALVKSAVEELAKEYKSDVNFNILFQMAVHYDSHFEITHAMSHELFKKYCAHLWETNRLEEGAFFCKKLIAAIIAWKYNGINVTKLEAWTKIMYYLLITYKVYTDKKLEIKKQGKQSIKKATKKAAKHPTTKDTQNTTFDFTKLAINLLECYSAITRWFNWDALDIDKKIYPFLENSLEMVQNCHELIMDETLLQTIIESVVV